MTQHAAIIFKIAGLDKFGPRETWTDILQSLAPKLKKKKPSPAYSLSNPEEIDLLVQLCLIRVGAKFCRTAVQNCPKCQYFFFFLLL